MPRLSVNIDLTYLPLDSRDTALVNIGEALQRITVAIRRTVPGVTVHEIRTRRAEHISKLTVSTAEATIVNVALNILALGTRAIGRGRGDSLETSLIRQEDMPLDFVNLSL